jgi:hypothetical protein
MIKTSARFLALAWTAWMLPSASAQLSLYTVQSGVATPVGSSYDFGSVALGSSEDVQFLLTYNGATNPYYLVYFSPLSAGFSVTQQDWPMGSLPIAIPPAGLHFTVQFQPSQAGSYAAPMQLNQTGGVSTLLYGQGAASLTVFENGQPLTSGQTISFPGNVPTGASEPVTVTLANQTQVSIAVPTIAIQGNGFSLSGAPATGVSVPAGGSLPFNIVFTPVAAGQSNGTLTVGILSFPLQGEDVPSLSILLNGQPLTANQVISFAGNVNIGASASAAITLSNPTQTAVAVPAIGIQGPGFTLSGAPTAGTTVPAGGSLPFNIVFAPTAAGQQTGTLTVGALTFPLQGTAVTPPPPVYPQPSATVSLPSTASAQQGALTVSLASASPAAGTGTVILTFTSSVAAVSDDPSITFADGTRSASFTVTAGSSAVQFADGTTSVSFATGTTAGTLNFAVTMETLTTETSVTIPSAPIGVDAAVATRDAGCIPVDSYCTTVNVELQINAWDNTRSASQVVFRFYNPSGTEIAPGDIPWSGASTAFQQYFAGSDIGGIFSIDAIFPINGDSTQVTSAVALLTNSDGTTQTLKIEF